MQKYFEIYIRDVAVNSMFHYLGKYARWLQFFLKILISRYQRKLKAKFFNLNVGPYHPDKSGGMYSVDHPSMHPFSTAYPIRGYGQAGVYLSIFG